MHTLQLQSTDSREANEDELHEAGITPEQVPQKLHIMAHQAATVHALRHSDAPIIINEAMTGDGKTLAGRFRLFNDRLPTFTMYPTNELIEDQVRGLTEQLQDWPLPHWKGKMPIYEKLNAPRLDDFQADIDFSRTDKLRWILDSDFILTNPDIFHLMIQFAYTRHGTSHDTILGELVQRYQLFVFDEFHLFGAPQTASVMIAVLLLKAISSAKRPPRFLFLSATPHSPLTFLAAKANLQVERITGFYEHGRPEILPGYRRIMQQAKLMLYPEHLEAWLEAHFDDIIRCFFTENKPAAKGIIIANSVAVAHRAFKFLQPLCGDIGIRLEINTGLTPIAQRGRVFDLLVATSTVDVGVDFKINLLVFESGDAANHMQRLGRLGRHQDDGNGNRFEYFEAHALLPEWVIDGLKAKLPDGVTVDRQSYKSILEDIYPPLQQFQDYTRKWAGLQAAHVLGELGKAEIKTQYESVRNELKEPFKALFPGGVKKYISLRDDKQESILEAARSFRGGSLFTALIVDPTGKSETVVSYNLISLLMNADVIAIDLGEMYRHAERQGQSRKVLERGNPLAAYRLVDWLPKLRPINIRLEHSLDNPILHETVIELDGFSLEAPDIPELHRLNRELQERVLAVLLLPGEDPETLRRRLRLGYQLEMFKFTSVDGIQGCAAFGRDALLLDSVLYRQRTHKSNNPFIY